MKDRPAGSYIVDKKGDLKPNLEDGAMKARSEAEKAAQDKKQEVRKDG